MASVLRRRLHIFVSADTEECHLTSWRSKVKDVIIQPCHVLVTEIADHCNATEMSYTFGPAA